MMSSLVAQMVKNLPTMKEKWKWSRSAMSDSSGPHGLYPTSLLCPWNFPGKSTGVGCHFLLQGLFLMQGLNPGLLHCRQTLYPLSHQVSQGNLASFPGSKRSLGGGNDYPLQYSSASLVAQMVKSFPQCRRPGFDPWVGKNTWRREQIPTPLFLTGEFHGQRILMGCSPWGCKESDTTELLTFHFHCRGKEIRVRRSE